MQNQAKNIHANESVYMPRVDLYGLVHKGLRSALTLVLMRLGRCSAEDASALQQALDDLEGVLYMCVSHAGHEDRVVMPAIEAARPGASATLAATHEQQERDIAALRAFAAELSGASEAQRPALLRRLYLRYAAFVGANLLHMTEEEEFAQPLLEAAYSSAQLEAMLGRIRAAVGPEESFAFMRVMLPAIAAQERAPLLAGLRKAMPAEVRSALSGLLHGQLPPAELAVLSGAASP